MKILVKFGTERLTISAAAARVGISPTAMRHRITQGWPKEKLFIVASHSNRCTPSKLVQPPERSANQLSKIMREYTSPFRAAMDAEITADEYLSLEKLDE